jgi:hypothetical protein
MFYYSGQSISLNINVAIASIPHSDDIPTHHNISAALEGFWSSF